MARVIPGELSERVRAAASALRGELEDRRRRRQRQLAMAGVAMLLAAGVAVWFAVRAYRVQDFAARLAVLRDSGEVEAAEKLSEELRSGHAVSQPQRCSTRGSRRSNAGLARCGRASATQTCGFRSWKRRRPQTSRVSNRSRSSRNWKRQRSSSRRCR
jgi:hypothetical protein